MRVRPLIAVWALASALFCAAAQAQAQSWPNRPITIVVPAAAGGLTDVLTRGIAQRLSQSWGQSVVIENRGGGGHNIGAVAVAKAAPDGYTLLASEGGAFVANPFLYSKLPYDAENDFVPISGFGEASMGLLINPSVPARNVGELIAYAKAHPGQVSYGTAGVGSILHISILLMESMAGIKLTPVHYRGAAPALNDLVGGHINLASMGPSIALPSVKDGKIKLLAVAKGQRWAQLPDTPTFEESGLPGCRAATWFGLFAPAKTPREVVTKIHDDVQRILKDAEFQRRFMDVQLLDPMVGTQEQFVGFIRFDAAKWGKVLREANVKVD
jgi:tripartite-type tricarboxylate transporter receptor subunit TctC